MCDMYSTVLIFYYDVTGVLLSALGLEHRLN